jgi:hypothetical protein
MYKYDMELKINFEFFGCRYKINIRELKIIKNRPDGRYITIDIHDNSDIPLIRATIDDKYIYITLGKEYMIDNELKYIGTDIILLSRDSEVFLPGGTKLG